MSTCCVCVCVCARARACVRACARVCMWVSKWKKECQTNGKHSKRKSQTQWKEKYRKGRGPFRQSSHCHPDKRKGERLSTKSTHVTVYLFRDLNRDRSRLLWMTVGPKGQYSAKRRTRNRQSSKTFKRWSNLHRRRPLAVLRTSGVIVHLAPGRERHVELLVMYDQTFGTRTLLAHAQQRRKEKKKKRKEKKILASAPLHTQDTEIGLGALVWQPQPSFSISDRSCLMAEKSRQNASRIARQKMKTGCERHGERESERRREDRATKLGRTRKTIRCYQSEQ